MITILLILAGLCLGSFVNALSWRLYKKRNWVSERSECTHCHHKLAWHDLIPVISWLTLRGKCRYCGKPIEDSPLTELATAGLFVLSYTFWPYGLSGFNWVSFGIWLVLLVGFMTMTVSDLRWMILPNKLLAIFGIVAFAHISLVAVNQNQPGLLLGGLMGGVLLFAAFYGLFQVSDGKWIGGGDVKLVPMLGLLAGGVGQSLLLLFAASFMGTLVVLPLLVSKKAKLTQRIPFGPFLLAGTILVYLFGHRLIDWYQGLLAV